MHERIKEYDRDIPLARTQSSAVSEHSNVTGHYPLWDEVKFIDRDPHWYTRRVKEAIHIRLHPDITSIGIMELKFRKCGCPRSNNTAADRYQGGWPREQFLV